MTELSFFHNLYLSKFLKVFYIYISDSKKMIVKQKYKKESSRNVDKLASEFSLESLFMSNYMTL